jgi:hypothetical protein
MHMPWYMASLGPNNINCGEPKLPKSGVRKPPAHNPPKANVAANQGHNRLPFTLWV